MDAAALTVGILVAAFLLAKGIYWLERRDIAREAREGQAQLERYLAQRN